jgi:hypothetical protein
MAYEQDLDLLENVDLISNLKILIEQSGIEVLKSFILIPS